MNKKFYISFFILNFLFTLLYIIYPTTKIGLQIDDIYYKFNKNTPNKNIVFVQIGERSINKFGRWPWDREVLAKNLLYLKKAKVVALDMVFSEPTNKDNFLANSLSQIPSVCGFFLRKKATQNITENMLDILSDSSIDLNNVSLMGANYAETNVENILQSCSLNGVFSIIADTDELFRYYPIAFIYKNMIFPSLGVQTLRFYLNKEINIKNHTLILDKLKVPLNNQNLLKLNYYPLNKYQIIPFTKIKDYDFTNKIVILGLSEIGISDIKSTPLGQIPGPLLHYTFISNILNKDFIKQYKFLDIIFILIFIFIPIILKNKNVLKRLLSYMIISISYFLAAILLYKNFNIEIDLYYPLLFLILNISFVESFLFIKQEKQEKFLKDAFESYLSPTLLKELIKHPQKLKLSGEQKELTILFTDIRSFTTISEKMKPDEVVEMLNDIFTPLSEIIIKNNGMVDKYIGDAIMALFNAPLDIPNHTEMACKSAIKMQLTLQKINKQRKEQKLPEINMGIGINTDKVFVGNMGSKIKFNYSAVGDGVNLASRLESETKKLGVKILISQNSYDKISKKFICEYKGEVFVKGKTESVKVYSLIGYENIRI